MLFYDVFSIKLTKKKNKLNIPNQSHVNPLKVDKTAEKLPFLGRD
jgi:hypothetical protein